MAVTKTITNVSTVVPDQLRQEIAPPNDVYIGKKAIPISSEEYQKIVSNAINREIKASAFYKGAAEMVKDKALQTLFNDFAGEEIRHREFLEAQLVADKKVMHFDRADDYKVTDSMKIPELTPDMKPLDGIVLAIKNELESTVVYSQLADSSLESGQRELYLNLAAMARANKCRLEEIYTNMAYPEKW